jgi:hypothetical protein
MTNFQIHFREEVIPNPETPNLSSQNLLELTGQLKFTAVNRCRHYDYFKWKSQMKGKIAAKIQKMIYGDILYELAKAQNSILTMREVDWPQVERIFNDLRNSIPKITHENHP